MILNEKTQNYVFVDPIKSYNFHIKSTSISHHMIKIWFFQGDKRVYAINIAKTLFNFLSILTMSNEKTQN
jgi:hypothetical protein